MSERGELLKQYDRTFAQSVRNPAIEELEQMHQRAFGIIHSGASRQAFEIEREPAAVRDLFGRHKFGQSVLLACRLVEAGVRLVQVNWPREPGDQSAGSPLWDTHQKNAQRVREVLCPQFDLIYSTLIADLESRGLLNETLVVVMGEFGRSPTINKSGGRDH